MKKKEIFIFGGIFLCALIAWIVSGIFYHSKDYGSIRILCDSELFGVFSLGEDRVIPIGDTNTCTIKDGTAVMSDADCPDHICMEMGPIDENGGMITCLPNRIFIEGIPSEDSVTQDHEIDAIG